jgi:uncharacterized protein YyaL (SSP411 family)
VAREQPRALEAAAHIGERLTAAAAAEARRVSRGSRCSRRAGGARAVVRLPAWRLRSGTEVPERGALDLLHDDYLETGTPWAGRIVEETLDAMIAGGFNDQLGGGFHRYSTDARWLIPHFEKMAYDNGVLLATCAARVRRAGDAAVPRGRGRRGRSLSRHPPPACFATAAFPPPRMPTTVRTMTATTGRGHVAIGHIAAARYLGRNDAGESALRALDRIWQEGYDAERGVTHRLGDRDAPETLDDQAHTARALLDAFELTQDQSWLDRAASVLRRMLSRFSDDSGGLRDRPRDATSSIAVLEREHLPISDSPMPSGNGSAALALLRLHALSGEDAWRDAGHAILRAFAASVPRFAGSAATYVKAVAWAVQPVTTVVVVEGLDGPLLPTALQTYRPRTVVRRLSPAAPTAGVPPEIQAMLTGDAPRAYVCAGHVCAPPVATAAGLAGLLADFRG